MASILVTGATGFLGGEVAAQLLAAGAKVRTTGRRPRDGQALPDFRPLDLADCYTLLPLLRDVRCVVHAAGLAHQFRGVARDDAAFYQANAAATQRLASAAAQSGVERFVLVSSVAVYGLSCGGEVDESALCQPTTPYGRSKLAAEQNLAEIASATGMQAVVLRPVTLYGERDPGNVGRLMRAIDRGRFLWIGEGRNRKSLIHRDDAARACVLAALRPPPRPYACYNVAAGTATMREIVGQLCLELHRPCPRLRVPAALAQTLLPGATRWRGTLDTWLRDDVYSGRRFAHEYSFEPRIALDEGLSRQVAAYRGCPMTVPLVEAA
jgi:nucleoside-diphosphate-sugar epimerase